ncbi:hypothetical protein FVEN_g13016 [Fusarium venenatum]|nr:hypothetical protein FVEN_g13016 [Fusarium venenatum]
MRPILLSLGASAGRADGPSRGQGKATYCPVLSVGHRLGQSTVVGVGVGARSGTPRSYLGWLSTSSMY